MKYNKTSRKINAKSINCNISKQRQQLKTHLLNFPQIVCVGKKERLISLFCTQEISQRYPKEQKAELKRTKVFEEMQGNGEFVVTKREEDW